MYLVMELVSKSWAGNQICPPPKSLIAIGSLQSLAQPPLSQILVKLLAIATGLGSSPDHRATRCGPKKHGQAYGDSLHV